MREKDFLALMDALGDDFGEEAVTQTTGSLVNDPHRSIIFKITTVIAAAAVVLILTGTVILMRAGSRPAIAKVAYPVGENAAADAEKFSAVPVGDPHERALYYQTEVQSVFRHGDSVGYSSAFHYETLARSDKGIYSIGVPNTDSKDARNGLCFTDFETGETVYLCAKPECLHDGSSFCNATTQNYDFCSLAYCEGMLYALATKHTTDTEHPDRAMLLACQPDGSGITEIAEVSDYGAIENCEMIAHRGALWLYVVAANELASSDSVIDKGMAMHRNRCGLYHYDLRTRQLTWVTGSTPTATYCNTDTIKQLIGAGDYVYFLQTANGPYALHEGLYQVDIRTGVIRDTGADTTYLFTYTACEDAVFYTRRAKEASEETKGEYEMYRISVADGTETSALVPRGDLVFAVDSDMIFMRLNQNLVCFDSEGNEHPGQYDRHVYEGEHSMHYGYADGEIWYFEQSQFNNRDDIGFWWGDMLEITKQPLSEAMFSAFRSDVPQPPTEICTLYNITERKTWDWIEQLPEG